MIMLHDIKEFNSPNEFNRFVKYVSGLLQEGKLEEVEPQTTYLGNDLSDVQKERWFKDKSSNDIWRLVPPDFPFKGLFKKVN